MKTKLLRKVRKNICVLENGLGSRCIAKRTFFDKWKPISEVDHIMFVNYVKSIYLRRINEIPSGELLLIYLRSQYGEFTRRYQDAYLKKHTWEKANYIL